MQLVVNRIEFPRTEKIQICALGIEDRRKVDASGRVRLKVAPSSILQTRMIVARGLEAHWYAMKRPSGEKLKLPICACRLMQHA